MQTDKTKIQEKLLHDQNFYQTLVENTQDLIQVISPDGHFLYTNETWCKKLGYTKTDLLDLTLWDIIHPDFYPHCQTIFPQVLGGATVLIQAMFVAKDGCILTLEGNASPYYVEGEIVATHSFFHDISQRKQAIEALQKSEQLVKEIITSISDVVYVSHLTKNDVWEVIYLSPHIELLTGYDYAKFKADWNFWPTIVIHPDDYSIAHKQAIQFTQGKNSKVDYRIVHKDGPTIWVRDSGRVEYLDDTSKMVYGVISNITEIKQIETALRKSRNTLRTFIDASTEIMILINLDYTISALNYTASELVNQAPYNLIGTSVFTLFPSNTVKQRQAKCEAVISSGKKIYFEDEDNQIWFGNNYYPVFDQQGQVIQLALVIRNITEQKWTEVALREAYQRLTLYLKHSPLIVIEWDSEFQVIHWSAEAKILFGWDANEVIGKHPTQWNFILDEDVKIINHLINDLLAGKQNQFVAINGNYTKTGQIVYCEWYNAALFDKSGNLTSVLSLVLDITDRRQAELALKKERALLTQRVEERTNELSIANAELARANRLKDEFLAGMSHELRTPLNAILGMAEILDDEIYGPLNTEQRESVQQITDSGTHLLSLINDILDLAKVEAGKLELVMDMVNIHSVVSISLQFVKQMAHKKRIKLFSMIQEGLTSFWSDERRLKQILVNLLSNAVKFTPDGGRVGIEVEGDVEKERIQFTVWDTGIGIKAEHIEYLFQDFTQLDSKLSRRHEGTGLGLALVYRMVDLHGGSITVDSEIDKGSQFVVSLPWQKGDKSNQPEIDDTTSTTQPVSQKAGGVQPLILLAEDNPANIKMMSAYLRHQDYQLLIAKNGLEAVSLAQENNPDLILMDIQMPEMSGFEAIEMIRTDETFKQTPIIAITALAMVGDRERCLEAGANDYISKPVSLKNLTQAINDLLS